jgi:O-antigen ligase
MALVVVLNSQRSIYDHGISALLILFAASSMLSVAISQICLGVLALLMVGRAVWKRERPCHVPFEWSVGIVVVWGLLMIPFSTDPGFSFMMSKRFALYSALWVGACLVDDEGRRRNMFWALVLAIAANAVFTAMTEEYELNGTGRRVTMVQDSAMTGAWIMACASIVMFAFIIVLKSWRLRMLLMVAELPLLFVIYLSRTRSAWLGLLAGLLVVLFVTRKRLIPVVAVALMLMVVLGPSGFKDRVVSIFDPSYSSNNVRLEQWGAGLDLIKLKPVTGVGDVYLADLIAEHTDYVNTFTSSMHHLHQSYVTTAVFWGIPGLVALLVLMGHLLVLLIKAWRHGGDEGPYRQGWVLGALGVWVFYCLTGMIDALVIDPEMSLVFLGVMGVGVGARRNDLYTELD